MNGQAKCGTYTHTINYYSALKRRDIFMCTATGINTGDIMPDEISQSQKDK